MRSRFLVTRVQLGILLSHIQSNCCHDDACLEMKNIMTYQCVGVSDALIDTDVKNVKIIFGGED